MPRESAEFVGSGGIESSAGYVADAAGDIYGTMANSGPAGDGSIFELPAASHAIITVVTFNGKNGSVPGGLVIDSAGNIYGTTGDDGPKRGGTVFELPHGRARITALASFNARSEGPSSLIIDSAGNLFGATNAGGPNGRGTLFELPARHRKFKALASIPRDDTGPGELAVDAAGNLYGSASLFDIDPGPPAGAIVFELARGRHKITDLATFDYVFRPAALVVDATGNVFTTVANLLPGGTLYEIQHGTRGATALASFGAGTGSPSGGVILDSAGNIFGTAQNIIFEVPAGGDTVETLATYSQSSLMSSDASQGLVLDETGAPALYLATFGGTPSDAAVLDPVPLTPSAPTNLDAGLTSIELPSSDVVVAADSEGNVYGTNPTGDGSLFELAKGSSITTTLASFDGTDGIYPISRDPYEGVQTGFALDAAGNLFGETDSGGANNDGTVFELAAGSRTITALASFTSTNTFSVVGLDAEGNLYGSSYAQDESGAVYELAKGSGTITFLASLPPDQSSSSDLVVDAAGNLYGTTGLSANGTIFELVRGTNTVTTLASQPGESPFDLQIDGDGNVYWTTSQDGGTVFELPHGSSKTTVLTSLGGSVDNLSGLAVDTAGDVYLTVGGSSTGVIVYDMVRGGNALTTRYAFAANDPRAPNQLFTDAVGDLFGTTFSGLVFELPRVTTSVSAAAAAPEVTSASPSESITVTYSDAAGINPASITAAGVSVVTPGGIPLSVTAVTVSPDTGSPASVTAVYTAAAPGGQWSALDNGVFTVTVNPGAVLNSAGGTNAFASTHFVVNLPPPTPT